MEKIKAAVIGVGHLGQHHARIYSTLPEVQLVGVLDKDKNKATSIASLYHCQSFTNYSDLLSQVQAISIATPTSSHFDMVRKALDRKINILVEKPLASTLSEAGKLVGLSQQNKAVLQVGHIERFNPAFLALENFQPKPNFIEAHRLSVFNPRGTDVDVILDLMIHDIDLVLSLVKSPVTKVEACAIPVITGSEDIANARVSFKNGCVANLTASRISTRPMRKIRIFQKNYYFSLDLLDKYLEVYKLGETVAPLVKFGFMPILNFKNKKIFYSKPDLEKTDMLTEEIKSFISSIQNKTTPKVSGRDGKEAIKVAFQIIQKAKLYRRKSK